jgi:hypothetical protein
MSRLHTVRLSKIIIEQEQLALLFQSNTLHTLILFLCRPPRMDSLPPSRIRHLKVSLTDDMEPLLTHCSANLEYLDFAGRLYKVPQSTKLPLFPKLRTLKIGVVSGSASHLDTLTSLAPQLEHLEVYGSPVSGWPALPPGLNHLVVNQQMIEHGHLGFHPFSRFLHLRIKDYSHVDVFGSRRSITPMIQYMFPNLTSLDVDIRYYSCNGVLLLARTLPNVTRLQLNIKEDQWLQKHEEPIDDTTNPGQYPAETLEGPLSSVHVNVTLTYNRQRCMQLCEHWVVHTVLWPAAGLGGPNLQEVELVFSEPDTLPVLWWCWKQVKEEWSFKRY